MFSRTASLFLYSTTTTDTPFLPSFLILQRDDSIQMKNKEKAHFAALAMAKLEEEEAAKKKEDDRVNAMSAEERAIYLKKVEDDEKHEKAKKKHLKVLAKSASGMHLTHKKGGKTKRKKIAGKKKGRTKKKSVE
jgi:CRISPR/Cas system CSM-associated protein Csm4 (group 5 of RAMP superfamily)